MTSLSFSEYLELSPVEQTVADLLYWKEFTDPDRRRFLADLFWMALAAGESIDQKLSHDQSAPYITGA